MQQLEKRISDLDRRIEAQVIAIEEGLDARLAQERIETLREHKQELLGLLADEKAEESELIGLESACEILGAIPDLSSSLRDAPPELLRDLFDAFRLTIDFDASEGELTIRAFVSSALAAVTSIEDCAAVGTGGAKVSNPDIAGAGFEPATSGL